MTETVSGPNRDDPHRWPHGCEHRLELGIGGSVVRHLQHIHLAERQTTQHCTLGIRPKQHGHARTGRAHDERTVIRLPPRECRRRPQHIQCPKPHPQLITRRQRSYGTLGTRLDGRGDFGRLRRKHRSCRDRCDNRRKSTGMIGLVMRHKDRRQATDAQHAKLPDHPGGLAWAARCPQAPSRLQVIEARWRRPAQRRAP